MSNALKVAPFFLLRTPALPAAALESLRADYARNGSVLENELLARPFTREAIFLASSSLYGKVFSGENAERRDRLGLAAARYLFRMATRCTPFGLFGGVTVGNVGERLSLHVENASEARRFCRIDQAAITEFHRRLFANSTFIEQCVLAENSSVWQAPDGVRYVEVAAGTDPAEYRLARIDCTEPVRAVLNILADGPCSFAQLTELLAARFTMPSETVANFLKTLVAEQLLLLQPQIPVAAVDPVRDSCRKLLDLPAAHEAAGTLVKVLDALDGVTTNSSANLAAYERASALMRGAGVEYEPAKLIQVDMHRPAVDVELPHHLMEHLASQLWSLRAVLAASHDEALQTFANAFTDRYGDAAVPLLEALDDDFGLGFGSTRITANLLEHLAPHRGPETITLDRIDGLLHRRMIGVLSEGHRTIVLTDEDLADLTKPSDDLPSTFTVLGSFFAPDLEHLQQCRYVFDLAGIYGAPASALLGRFCNGDAVLTQRLQVELARTECDREDVVLAEIIHQVHGRAGNVVLRPPLRPYEIAYLGHSATAPEYQICVRDLLVTCQNGRVCLYSKKLKKRVLPRLSSAHMYSNPDNVPVYRFLATLQNQNEPRPRGLWSNFPDNLPFVPEVRYRNVRLARAQWRLTSADLKTITDRAIEQDPSFGLAKLRMAGPLVRLRQGDNFLELDLRHALDRALLVEECRRGQGLLIEDASQAAGTQDLVQDRAGAAFRHEVAVPMSRCHPAERLALLPLDMPPPTPNVPGKEWFYACLSCGTSAMDMLIADVFPPFAERAIRSGCATPFFLRYWEKGGQLRIRVRGEPKQVWTALREEFEAMLTPYLANRTVAHLEYRTYQPEYQRYGGVEAMGACERIFSADSVAVAHALPMLARPNDQAARWQFAIRSIWELLRAFVLEAEEELALLRNMGAHYAAEFGFDRNETGILNEKYRRHRNAVSGLIADVDGLAPELGGLLQSRAQMIAESVGTLKSVLPLPRLRVCVASLIHMAANRVFPDNGKLYELVLLHFLVKAVSSERGKARFQEKMLAAQDGVG